MKRIARGVPDRILFGNIFSTPSFTKSCKEQGVAGGFSGFPPVPETWAVIVQETGRPPPRRSDWSILRSALSGMVGRATGRGIRNAVRPGVRRSRRIISLRAENTRLSSVVPRTGARVRWTIFFHFPGRPWAESSPANGLSAISLRLPEWRGSAPAISAPVGKRVRHGLVDSLDGVILWTNHLPSA